ncbi:MAG TPA: fatty acid--CoA ligase family protein, partial [Acidimicrobiales bacterium]
FYTSGTTGKPKGVSLTHRGLLGRLPRAMTVPLEVLGPGEAVLALPVAHIMGFAAALAFACAGVPVYSMDRFRPVEVLDAIEHRRASIFIGVPAMYRMLIDAGAEQRDLRCVQVWMSGADAMPSDLARRFQRMGSSITLPVVGGIGEALFVEGYGMAELSGAAAGKVLPPYVSRWFAADGLGIPLPGYRFKILGDDDQPVRLGQVGELWVKGPGVTTGYWGDADATSATRTPDGWLRTGDVVRRGAFGTFRFAGRAKDVIKHGGYSVYTVEVQHLLEQHPAVLEAAVVGLPDERTGELVAAAVHLRAGEVTTADELSAFCHEHLARYKCPERFAFVEALPRTGSNKVQRQALRALFEGG